MNTGNDRTTSGNQIKLRAFENLLTLIVAESHSHPTYIENCLVGAASSRDKDAVRLNSGINGQWITPRKICSPSGF